MEEPKRAVQFALNLQADSIEELEDALFNILTSLERKELRSVGCSGGVGSGYTYELLIAKHPTHKEYVQQLNKYLDYLNPSRSN